MNDPQSREQAAPFVRAWDDYVAASQAIFERLKDPAALSASSGVSLPVFGAWGEFAKSLGMRSEDVLSGVAPALGHMREYQIIVQRMSDLGAQFQSCYADFQKQSAAIGEQALQAVRKRCAADPALANSPAATYETWIDSAERAYAQAAHSEPFARSMGQMCNLLSAFKVERGKLLETLARHLNLPSRSEIDSLHRQVNELAAALRKAAGK